MKLRTDFLNIDRQELESDLEEASRCYEKLGDYCDCGAGWMEYILSEEREERIEELLRTAERIRTIATTFVVIGIGGSYLGSKAMIEALSPHLEGGIAHVPVRRDVSGSRISDAGHLSEEGAAGGVNPRIVFAGQNLSADYLSEVLGLIRRTDVCVNIISKSGSTVESDIASRLVMRAMTEKYGDAVRGRVFVTTDPTTGMLRRYAEKRGFACFDIPPSIGGRFSVCTPVGLLPMAVAGIDIRAFFSGLRRGAEKYGNGDPENPALRYAAVRNHLDAHGKDVELLAVYEPRHSGLAAWWVQLFGESCGKDGVGLFPASASYTTDLHSIGQLVQEGRRNLFETVLWCGSKDDLVVPELDASLGVQDFVGGRLLSEVGRAAYLGTMRAHTEGGVPCIGIELDANSAEELGELLYFFMMAVSISALAQGLNPFDQPGVEAYKAGMRELLE